MVVPFTTPDSTLHSLLRLTYPRQVEIVCVNTADGYITPAFRQHSLKYFKLNQEISDLTDSADDNIPLHKFSPSRL